MLFTCFISSLLIFSFNLFLSQSGIPNALKQVLSTLKLSFWEPFYYAEAYRGGRPPTACFCYRVNEDLINRRRYLRCGSVPESTNLVQMSRFTAEGHYATWQCWRLANETTPVHNPAVDTQAAAVSRRSDFFYLSRKAAVFFGLAEKPQ